MIPITIRGTWVMGWHSLCMRLKKFYSEGLKFIKQVIEIESVDKMLDPGFWHFKLG